MSSAVLEGTDRAAARRPLSFERPYLGTLFVLFSALSFLFPRTGDDWAWGSQIGIDRLDTWFKNYNGRYGGDLVVIALTRAPVVAQLVTGALLTLIVFLIADLADHRTPLGYLTITALLLAMPKEVWRQAVVWISGFTNYGFATVGALVFLWAAKRDWTGRLVAGRAWRRAPFVLLFGFVAALFMENVTLYLVVAALVYVVAFRIVRRRFSIDSIAWAVAFLVGAAVMFSNGAYRRAANTKQQYQQIQPGGGGLKQDLKALGNQVYQLAIGENTVLNVALVLVVCVLVGTAAFDRRRSGVPVVLIGAFLAASQALRLVEQNLTPSVGWRVFGGYLSGLLLFGGLVAAAQYAVADRARRVQLFVALASVVVVSAPMAAVHPIGPRCFFVSYAFFLVVAAGMLREAVDRVGGGLAIRLAPFAGALAATVLVSYFVIYGLITNAAQNRLDYVRAEVHKGASTVRVKQLPFGDYVHVGDPTPQVWEYRYKLYYGLPQDLRIVVIPRKH